MATTANKPTANENLTLDTTKTFRQARTSAQQTKTRNTALRSKPSSLSYRSRARLRSRGSKESVWIRSERGSERTSPSNALLLGKGHDRKTVRRCRQRAHTVRAGTVATI